MDSLRITFSAENAFCSSNESVKNINIVPPLDTPMVYCTATDNSVLFQWEDDQRAEDYQINVLTGNMGVINGNSYLVDGLLPGEVVTIAIRSLSSVDCADSEEVEFTCIAGCDPIEFSISVMDTFVCAGITSIPISLNLPNTTNPQTEILGMGVTESVFNSDNLAPGIYDIVGILTIDGCQYVDSITIEIGSTPSYILNIDGPICPQDETGLLTFDLVEGIVLFEGEELLGNTISVSPGNYSFEVRGDNGCSNFDNIIINPTQTPDLNLNALTVIDQGALINLPIEVGDFDTGRINSVTWFDDRGQILCSGDFESCNNLMYEPDNDDLVCADIDFDNNCIITLCSQINLRRIVNIFVPDIFTPNEDGMNDEFIFLSNQRDVIVEGFYIFNRWGELMHSIQNIPIESEAASWDGNYKGKPAAEGVYVYIIEYVQDGKTLLKKGDVTLIR
jgi:gliding motility-associated-like protein